MTTSLEITGNLRDRFIQVAALLHLLNPVRGEPTAYGLDQDAPNLQAPKEQVLKRKFLDCLALICATRQDGDAVSAACLEEGGPEGTVIRIASNAGVSEETLSQLQSILGLLSSISNEGMRSSRLSSKNWADCFIPTVAGSPSREREVLVMIIQLDIAKIRKYIRNLQKSRDVFKESITALKTRLIDASPDRALPSIQQFLEWFKKIHFIQSLSSELDPDVLLGCIIWAQKAKHIYHSLLTFAFSKGDQPLPRWVHIVFKLGRYGIAARVLVRTALDLPALFNPMFVKPIAAPPRAQFTIRDEEMPLSCVLRRIAEIKPEEIIPRLARIWNTNDPESFFRRFCPADLVTHAELQIVNFYDHNPQRMPRFKFIGVSKKSCYLCSVFLTAHPSGFYVSSCHQKLYLSWIPPPATLGKIYKQYKTMTKGMTTKLEAIVRHDLVRGLGSRGSLIPADSTAGVSITGLTESRSLEVTDFEEHDESYVDLGTNIDKGQPYLSTYARVADSHILSHSISFTPQSPDLQLGGINKKNYIGAEREFERQDSQVSILSMVFHFRYLGDESWQDIIMIKSVLDPYTHSPSWSKLVELLDQDNSLALDLRNSAVLIVNDHIRVRGQRQFVACLQYLLNSAVLNSEVMICDAHST